MNDIVRGDANGKVRYISDRNRADVSALLELLQSERATPFDTPFRPLPPYIGRYGWKVRSQISAELLNSRLRRTAVALRFGYRSEEARVPGCQLRSQGYSRKIFRPLKKAISGQSGRRRGVWDPRGQSDSEDRRSIAPARLGPPRRPGAARGGGGRPAGRAAAGRGPREP